MSTRLQLRTALSRRIGRSDVTTADLDRWLDDGLADLTTSRVQLRSLEYTGSPFNTTPSGASYPIDAAFFSLDWLEDTTNLRVITRFTGVWKDYLDAKQNASPGKPTQFIERGSMVYLHPTPDDVYAIVPYGYRRGTMGAANGDSPNIEAEWHYAIELIAAAHAWRELAEEERAAAAEGEFTAWYAKRDTPTKRTARFHSPAMRIRVVRRNARTGV